MMNVRKFHKLILALISLGASSPSIAETTVDQPTIDQLKLLQAKAVKATEDARKASAEALKYKKQLEAMQIKYLSLQKKVKDDTGTASPNKSDEVTKTTQTATSLYGTFLLRKDNLETSDILFPGTLGTNADTKGANFNWASNYIQNTNNITTQAYVSWLPPNLFGMNSTNDGGGSTKQHGDASTLQVLNYAIAPFSYLNGGLTNPFNVKTEKSAAQFGVNGELALIPPEPLPFSLATFSVLPYYQTDFRGYATIAGLQALVEPYNNNPNVRLGSQVNTGYQELFAWYWRLIGEANPIWVDDAGLTSFQSHTTYGLVGGQLQLRGTLFANMPSVGKALCGRISVLGSFQPMWDLSDYKTTTTIRGHTYVNDVHGGYLNNVHAEVDYDLIGKKSVVTEHCDGSSTPSSDQSKTPKSFLASQSFDASLTLTYDTGVDFSTYQRSNKFMLGLTLLY
jgi:hypothetical protein